jgi:transposase
MKTYSLDLRKKIVIAHLAQKMSSEESNHDVWWSAKVSSKKLVKQQQIEGNLQPKQRGKPQ